MRSVTVLAPAKLNLTLDVTGTRPDGYHTLDMIMQAYRYRMERAQSFQTGR